MTEQIITDLSDLRKYRTELPNLYDDAGLDPFEYRLLGHYKRVGTCTESIKTTAGKCDMSEGKVSECRQSLHEKGFIELVKVPVPNGFSYRINVVDKWMENFALYSGKSIQQIKNALDALNVVDPSRGEGYPSLSEGKPSPGETKNPPPLKNAFQLYEENIGPLTPLIADEIKDACDFYTEDWVKDAIQESAVSNKRGWKYIAAVLKGRKERGGVKEKKEQSITPTPPKFDPEKKLVRPEMFTKRQHAGS